MQDDKSLQLLRLQPLLRKYRKQWAKEQRIVDEVFSAVAESKSVQTVRYAVFIDTYSLFCQARDGLAPAFLYANAELASAETTLRGSNKYLKPSAGEYVEFAKLFLNQVTSAFEARQLKQFRNPMSEQTLREHIRQLMRNRRSAQNIPDPEAIVRFEKETYLFGAKFNKGEIIDRPSGLRRDAWNRRSAADIAAIDQLTTKVTDEDTILLRNYKKSYSFYNDFLEALRRDYETHLPGVYKYFINKGAFTRHHEKQVDTSLAIKSIECAYEDPALHQVFCLGDTDFVPVFEKLMSKGVSFSMVYVGVGDHFPDEFKKYEQAGRVTRVEYGRVCEQVLKSILDSFMHDGGAFYEGENKGVYSSWATLRWKEIHSEMSEQMDERTRVYEEMLSEELERLSDT